MIKHFLQLVIFTHLSSKCDELSFGVLLLGDFRGDPVKKHQIKFKQILVKQIQPSQWDGIKRKYFYQS